MADRLATGGQAAVCATAVTGGWKSSSPNIVSVRPRVHFLSGRAVADFKGKHRALFVQHTSSKADRDLPFQIPA